MVFVIPASNESLVVSEAKTYRYILNWKECHRAGGEIVDGVKKYSEDLVLSLVLSFLAPFSTNNVESARTAIPGVGALTKTEEVTGQEILALTLSAYMTLAKPATQRNVPAFTKRWQAALSGLGLTDLVPSTSWDKLTQVGMVFHTICATKPSLRSEIVAKMLTIQKVGAEGAILAQIKLVWSFASLKSVQLMDLFIKSHCRALEVPAVLDQAIELHEAWEEVRKQPDFMYSRVGDPNCYPQLNQANFPDLYYASISYAKSNRLIGDNFQMSSGHTSAHTGLIDKYIKKMAAAELGELSPEAKEKLGRLGYPVVTPSRRRTHPDDTDSDAEDEPPAQRPRGRRH